MKKKSKSSESIRISVGSICSGIEAASVAWTDQGYSFNWFSEISKFPSKFLAEKYPDISNIGDMNEIPGLLKDGKISAPDLICGGTPCQAFSLAGWKKGLNDIRGNLTLKFVEIINSNDARRDAEGKRKTIVFWENVEGVLNDKTNAFGCLLASLAGYEDELKLNKWPQAGLIRGPLRNIAWRVMDAKYFGLPQQRKRLYLIATGLDINPEEILFEYCSSTSSVKKLKQDGFKFEKEGHDIEVFRSYTDCLYSAYGTKWNGNAAAYNGSLYILQNLRLRRLTPLECERLMGFPDNYTNLIGATATTRYQAVGNSWAVPVVKWIGSRIKEESNKNNSQILNLIPAKQEVVISKDCTLIDLGKEYISLKNGNYLNGTIAPCDYFLGNIEKIVDVNAEEKFYITPVGCRGILRRKQERGLVINPRLEEVLTNISSMWSEEKIEKISRIQPRGTFSKNHESKESKSKRSQPELSLWEE